MKKDTFTATVPLAEARKAVENALGVRPLTWSIVTVDETRVTAFAYAFPTSGLRIGHMVLGIAGFFFGTPPGTSMSGMKYKAQTRIDLTCDLRSVAEGTELSINILYSNCDFTQLSSPNFLPHSVVRELLADVRSRLRLGA